MQPSERQLTDRALAALADIVAELERYRLCQKHGILVSAADPETDETAHARDDEQHR